MMPKVEGNQVEFFVIQTIYKKEMQDVKNELGMKVRQPVDKFVKEVYARVWMDKNEVGPYGQYVGSKGELLKARTLVFNRVTDSYYKVAHTVEEVRKAIQYSSTTIGYKKQNNEV